MASHTNDALIVSEMEQAIGTITKLKEKITKGEELTAGEDYIMRYVMNFRADTMGMIAA